MVVSLNAFAAGDQVLVRWETALEVGVISYDLVRVVEGRRVKVNQQAVLATGALRGGRYFVRDPAAAARATHRYELEAMLITGQPTVVASLEARATTVAVDDGLPAQGTELHPSATPARGSAIGPRAIRRAAPDPVDLVGSGATAAVKIRTTSGGTHFLGASTLAGLLGRTESEVAGWIADGRLAMSSQGQPVGYIPGTGSAGPGLFFYAERHQDNYTAENVYWLRRGENRVTEVDGGNPVAPAVSGTYRARIEAEQDAFAIMSVISDPEADYWAWQGLIAGVPGADTWSFPPFSLTDVVGDAAVPGTLRLRMVGGSRTRHLLRVRLNGTVLDEHSWSGLTAAALEFDVPAALLRSDTTGQGANTLTLTALLGPGVPASEVYVDGFEFEYTRRCRALGDRLEAQTAGSPVMSAEGFTGTDIAVFEVTEPRLPRLVTNVRVERVAGQYRACFLSRAGGRYSVFRPSVASASTAVTADRLSLAYPANLRDPGTRASYVVVTPAAFQDAAQRLAAYRADRLRTKVVLLEDLYNEFSDGLVTPQAIRRFVQMAYQEWAFPIRYLVLLGDGTYDYRNLQAANDGYVPPLMIPTDYGLFTSDSLYGDVMGDHTMRVAVGRLPVVSNGEAAAVLAKVQAYESETPPASLRALLVADRPDAAGDFVANLGLLEGYLGPRYVCQQVYPQPYPVGDRPPPVDVVGMRDAIQEGLANGLDILAYVGHGAADRFGRDKYLHVADVPGLKPGGRLPLAFAMTCVVGQYSNPGHECLGEALVLTPRVGAVAVVAPTGLSYDADATWISSRLLRVVGEATTGRLGDALLQTFSLYQAVGDLRTPVWMYNLLGDPALAIPRVTLPPGAGRFSGGRRPETASEFN